jgi:hypothetical protein
MKIIVMAMVTLLLNILCEKGLSVVSWVIVFIPFIMMTVIVSMLLYIFGLDASTGKLNYNSNNNNSNTNASSMQNVTVDALGNIIVYDPEYNPSKNPVYYQSPNIIIPNPSNNNTQTQQNTVAIAKPPNWNSSSPAYQS